MPKNCSTFASELKTKTTNIMNSKNPIYPIYDEGNLHVSISKGNQKLGNIPGFNTLAGNEPLTLKNGRMLTNIVGTCGSLCELCKNKCYAMRFSVQHHNSVVPAYAKNTVILRNDPQKLRAEINEYCKKNIVRYFRFHTSGELESIEQLRLYAQICKDNDEVVFYIYTKAFELLKQWFDELSANGESVPENFVINLSMWKNNVDEYLKDERFAKCNIFEYDEEKKSSFAHCPAIDKNGHETGVTCAMCRKCMRRGSKTAVYPH